MESRMVFGILVILKRYGVTDPDILFIRRKVTYRNFIS